MVDPQSKDYIYVLRRRRYVWGVRKTGKTEDQILQLLETSGTALTLVEIAERLGKKPSAVFRSLRKLFDEGQIGCDPKTRRYTLGKKE